MNMEGRSTANALLKLFDAQKESMNQEDIEWFSGLTDYAVLQIENVASTMNVLATLMYNDESSSPSNENLAEVLYGLASQTKALAALTRIGSEAEFLLYEQRKSEGQ